MLWPKRGKSLGLCDDSVQTYVPKKKTGDKNEKKSDSIYGRSTS